jgi:hypothetical protein
LTRRHTPLSQDAALVVALAGTAMPFAHSAEDEAERWLRALRLHGQVGAALQALGVGEAPLETLAQAPMVKTPRVKGQNPVAEVAAAARGYAAGREADLVATIDVLFGVLEVYGKAFDRALYVRGATRDELLERLAASAATPAH